jgi:trans-2-enoyl-CoA reductase
MISTKRFSIFLKNKIPKVFTTTQVTISTKAQELKLKEFGDLETSVFLNEHDLSHLNIQKNEILIKLVGSPINPADINIIQGKYALLPKIFPAQLGNEGVFEVINADQSKNLQVGDWIIPKSLGWGTWRSHAIANENEFIKVPNDLDKSICASLSVNPCTAYRMLKDFKPLSKGDTIIQNGANSGVGQAVIQFSKEIGVNVINIVRKRDNLDELYSYLKSIGAKYILTDEVLRKSNITNELWNEIPKPKLAFNCVGGKTVADMIRLLDSNSIMVTYGGMSRLPLTLNTADFIFKNLTCKGFWLSEWRQRNDEKEYEEMIRQVLEMIRKTNFKAQKFQEFKLFEYKEAFKNAQSKYLINKSLFVV